MRPEGIPAPAAPGATDAAAPATAPAAPEQPPADAVAASLALTPEALEALLAPIALYPDPVLAQVLTAATNPQMVLDAGNWLIQNPDLKGRALDEAAEPLGFSPSMRALLQFPEVVDMMCMKLDWTTQLGEAFNADQAGVLDAVQRLRRQSADVGNLASSDQLKVETEEQDGKEVITVEPADPKVVYVPQYDPVAVYAPPPATIPPPTTTTTTVVEEKKEGYTGGQMVTTGLLAFGAGLLVAEVFDDDDDYDNYYPNYGYGGVYYGGRPYYASACGLPPALWRRLPARQRLQPAAELPERLQQQHDHREQPGQRLLEQLRQSPRRKRQPARSAQEPDLHRPPEPLRAAVAGPAAAHAPGPGQRAAPARCQ